MWPHTTRWGEGRGGRGGREGEGEARGRGSEEEMRGEGKGREKTIEGSVRISALVWHLLYTFLCMYSICR